VKKIRAFFIVLTSLLILSSAESCMQKPVSVYKLISDIPGAEITRIKADSMYAAAWEIRIPQPLDHRHPEKGQFMQRIWLSHVDSLRPVVFITEGYAAKRNYVSELSRLLDANQIIVEHRYFGESVPDSMNWSYLTIEQAAADHHRIVRLFKKAYPGKWISTGISKGGQTTMYFRYFYPRDVDICIPYVGPLNFSPVDPRIFTFLDTVGTPECRQKIYNFQKRLLEERDSIFPLFEKYSKDKKYTFRRAGGDSAAYEYSVLEYPFAFWQWGMKCGDIPGIDKDADSVFQYFSKARIFNYFSDEGIKMFEPFYYQAMTQIGYYGYMPSQFPGEIRNITDSTFRFAAPQNVKLGYDSLIMRKVNAFLQNRGNHFLYIYGGTDTWSATAVHITGKADAIEIFKPGGPHFTRIRNLPEAQKNQVIQTLDKWLDMKIDPDRLH